MNRNPTRRAFLVGATASPLLARNRRVHAQQDTSAFGLPIGFPDRLPGDGFIVRHGYATENTWFNPGWFHAGEDWYATSGDTAGALIYAVADGDVVFAGWEYPGLVVIVRHADDLYSMYGHLDYALSGEAGERVKRGDVLGAVLARTDGLAPSHLHFEARTFLTKTDVNGDAPRYGVTCGFQCPPGPGYWPIDAPEHPSEVGGRNPTHVIARRAFPNGETPDEAEVVVSDAATGTAELWSAPDGADGARQIGDVDLIVGDRYRLLAVDAGREVTTETSAEGYRLWYRIALADSERAWVRAAVPSTIETGSDGRPSAVRFDFLPAFPV